MSDEVDAENLYIFLGAIYNELTELLIQVVSKHVLRHPHAGGAPDSDKALSNILSKDLPALRNIKSTSTATNVTLIFTNSERRKLHPSIEISKLDCSLLLDIVLQFPGFLETPNVLGDNCVHNVNTCCDSCNHTVGNKKKCTGCDRPKKDCEESSKICNGVCTTCLKCNVTRFEQIIASNEKQQSPENSICTFFMYSYCWKIMLSYRNMYGHSNKIKCKEFLDNVNGTIDLADFSFNTEEELKDFICVVFQLIWKHISVHSHLKNDFSTEEKDAFLDNIHLICTDIEFLTTFSERKKEIITERTMALKECLKDAEEQVEELIRELSKLKLQVKDDPKEFLINMSITSDNETTQSILTAKDMGVTGWFRKICHRTIIDSIQEVLGKQHVQDYQTSCQNCKFDDESTVSSANKSCIKFSMQIDDPFSNLQNVRADHTEDTILLCTQIENKLQQAICEARGPVEVILTNYKFKCIIIEGIIQLQHGVFSGIDDMHILEKAMRNEIKKEYENVSIELSPLIVTTRTYNYSAINFSMIISPVSPTFFWGIQHHLPAIQRSCGKKFNDIFKTPTVLPHNCLFVGNSGTGKSTLLNCLMKSRKPDMADTDLFSSGISIGDGLTFKLDQREVDGTTFMDTPGLTDVEMRKQAAEAISTALMQDGRYQVIFVVTIESGRVRPNDAAVVRLVLESAEEITHCGVIFNKLTKGVMRIVKNDPDIKTKLISELLPRGSQSNHRPVLLPLFLPRIEELDDVDDAVIKIPELETFITVLPEISIHRDVFAIQIKNQQEYIKRLEAQLIQLKKDNEYIRKEIEMDRKQFEKTLEEICEAKRMTHAAKMKIVGDHKRQLSLAQEKEKPEFRKGLKADTNLPNELKDHNCLFVGNPGSGKSTLLNCLMKAKKPDLNENELFKSGVSLVQGMTFSFDKRVIDGITYMDTPGLEDIKYRQQAAEEISKALKQNGKYQVVFVLTLESGRVRPQDVTLVNLVLECTPEIYQYGVIFNKLTRSAIGRIKKDSEYEMILLSQVSLQSAVTKQRPVPVPLFLPRIDELDDEVDAIVRIPELEKFMTTLPLIQIHKENVSDLAIDKYEEYTEHLQKQIEELRQSNKKMYERIRKDQEEFARRLQEIKELK